MSKIYKNGDGKKNKFQKIAWIIWDERELIQIFLFYYFLIGLFVSRDSISSILKENESIFVF